MKLKLWLFVSAVSLAVCSAAQAQDSAPTSSQTAAGASKSKTGVQEVVVTAERRNTNLQQTPIAATVLTENDLLKKGVFTIDQLQFVSPSLAVDNFGQVNDIVIWVLGIVVK